MLDVCLPGTGGTVPRLDRFLSCCYMRYEGRGLLIDCGEGTQLAVKKAGFSLGKIEAILLTHFHADHCSGLPGLLLSMGNEGHTDPLTICGPRGVDEIVRSLTVIASELPFRVRTKTLGDFDTAEQAGFSVTAFMAASAAAATRAMAVSDRSIFMSVDFAFFAITIRCLVLSV